MTTVGTIGIGAIPPLATFCRFFFIKKRPYKAMIMFYKLIFAGEPGVFSFSNVFDDNMVLQKSPSRATVWGFAENVRIYFLTSIMKV